MLPWILALIASMDLNKTRLRIVLHIIAGEGKQINEEDKGSLQNLRFHSLFNQVDIDFGVVDYGQCEFLLPV